MKKTNKRKMRITKGEKILYKSAVFCFAMTIILKIFCGASVSHLSMNVEKIRYEMETQEKKNESLVMKVNELTSFDKIKNIVSDMGLAYNKESKIESTNYAWRAL